MQSQPDENEDWIKGRTWDIWYQGHLVKTRAELEAVLPVGLTVAQFAHLPSARAMPATLRAELARAGIRVPAQIR